MRRDHTRLIFGNLSYNVTPEALRDELSKHVQVVRVDIPRHRNNSPKGVGIVDVKTPEEADGLHAKFHETMFLGRKCYISFGDEKRFQRVSRDRRERHHSRNRRDGSPLRHRSRSRDCSDSDDGPPHRRARDSSDSECSPPRRRTREYSDSDDSPPRARTRRRSSPRRRRAASSDVTD
jgi:RNA recognition motif-containing protein